jgi:hypothetical protein
LGIELRDGLLGRHLPSPTRAIPKPIDQAAHEDPVRSCLERGIIRYELVVLQQSIDIFLAEIPEPGEIDDRIAVGGVGEVDDPGEPRTIDQDVIVAEIVMREACRTRLKGRERIVKGIEACQCFRRNGARDLVTPLVAVQVGELRA